ncbi:hypothetical protein M9458_056093 [Cirrhinus mrigala]|uniref:Uncharacterized protein n=1 Tax=Cirrhinus mrigala TaxID=683832 RepID=A0ABD0MJ62_CIRMR
MELDSVSMLARLTEERAQSSDIIRRCGRGHAAQLVSYETTSALAPWPDPEMGMAPVASFSALDQTWRSYGQGHVILNTDASRMGWGAVCNGQAASGSWIGPRLQWHINCLELLAVFLALRRVLVRTDNMATVAYINHQGGLRSRRILKWLKSLRAVHIPGELNRAADALSCQLTLPGELRLHPRVVQHIWSRFGEAQIDLFASPESAHCQLFYSLTEAPLGTDALAHRWPQGLTNLLAQTLCKIREDEEQVLLVAPYWPTQTCPSLEDSPEKGPSFSGDGYYLAPAPRSLEPSRVASGRDVADLSGLPQAVVDIITQARAPSMRQAYALRFPPLLCPVRALHIYVDHTQSFRRSEQLFVCFGGQQKGNAVSNRGWPIGWSMPSPWRTSARGMYFVSVSAPPMGPGIIGIPAGPPLSWLPGRWGGYALSTCLARLPAGIVLNDVTRFRLVAFSIDPPNTSVLTRERRHYVPLGTTLDCARDAGIRLLSKNLSEWMHAAILYTRMYGGVEWHANSTRQFSLAFSSKDRR